MPFTFAHGDEDWQADIADPRLRREVEARLRRQASRHAVPAELPLVGHFVAGNQWVVAGREAGQEAVRGDVLSLGRRAELGCDPYEALIRAGLAWLAAFRPAAAAASDPPPAARTPAGGPDYLHRAWAWWLRLEVEEREHDYWSIVPAGTGADAWPQARFTVASGGAGQGFAPASGGGEESRERKPDRLSALESRLDGVLGRLETHLEASDGLVPKAKLDQVTSRIERGLPELRSKLDQVSSSIEQGLPDLRSRLDQVTSSVDQGLPELRSKLDQVTSSVDQDLPELRTRLDEITAGLARRRGEEPGRRGAGAWVLTAALVAGLLGFGGGWVAGKGAPDGEAGAGISDELVSMGNQLSDLLTFSTDATEKLEEIEERLQGLEDAEPATPEPIDVKGVLTALGKIENRLTSIERASGKRKKPKPEDGGDRPAPSSGSEGEGETADETSGGGSGGR